MKDTLFERKQHENTGKHQGNLKRFLQGIQKDHAKNEREKEKAKAEIERLNRVTGEGTSSTRPSSSALPLSKTSKSTSTSLSAADQKRQWTQLAEMGIAVPEHARAKMAMVGDWQTVSRKVVETQSNEQVDEKLNVGIRKRKLEDDEEQAEAPGPASRKGWGSTTKIYPGSQNMSEDLDSLLAGTIFKKSPSETKQSPSPDDVKQSFEADIAQPKTNIKEETTPADATPLFEVQTQEEQGKSNIGTRIVDINHEQVAIDKNIDAPAPVFKKRKAKQPPAPKDSLG